MASSEWPWGIVDYELQFYFFFFPPGYSLCLGKSCFFRFNHPEEASRMKSMLPPKSPVSALAYNTGTTRVSFSFHLSFFISPSSSCRPHHSVPLFGQVESHDVIGVLCESLDFSFQRQ